MSTMLGGSTKKQRVIQRILEGKSIEWVRRHEDVSLIKIKKWLIEFAQSGGSDKVFKSRQPPIRIQSLTAEQIKWVHHLVTSKSPIEMGLKKNLWTGYLLTITIQQWIKKNYPKSHSYDLLTDFGIEFFNPIPTLLTEEIVSFCNQAKEAKAQIVYLGSYNLKSSIEVVPNSEKKRAIIVKKIAVQTENYVLYAFNQTKKLGNRFTVNKQAPDVEIAKRFIEQFMQDLPGVFYFLVSPDSIFSSEEVTGFVFKSFVKSRIKVLPQRIN